jgi:uncharacterized spore protein YtfJ
MDQNINQYVDALFANMENFSQKDGLIGKPVTQGDKTFLPVMSITLGYGGGDTQSKSKTSSGNTASAGGGMMGGALGIGAKLATDAVIVIDKDNVLMAPVGTAGNMSQVINKIPQIINSMSSQGMQGGQQGTQQGSQSGPQPGAQANKGMY